MDLDEVGQVGQGLLESPCECGIEPLGSISYGLKLILHYLTASLTEWAECQTTDDEFN